MSDERDRRLEPLLGSADARGAVSGAPTFDMDELFAGIEAQIDEKRKSPRTRLREQPTGVRRMIAISALLGMVAFFWLVVPRADIGQFTEWSFLAAAAGMTVLGAIAAFIALRPCHVPELPTHRVVLLSALALLATVAVAFLPAPHEHVLAPAEGVSAMKAAMPCMFLGLIMAFPVYFLIRLLDRRSHLSAVVGGSVAGLIANVALQLKCPLHDTGHYLLGHSSVLVLFLLGTAAVAWFERSRG